MAAPVSFHPVAQTAPVPFREVMEVGLPCDLSAIDKQRWYLIPQGGNFQSLPERLRVKGEHSYIFRKLDVSKPSITIRKQDSYVGTYFHPTEPRYITLREKARISSFPDSFQWVGSGKDITARIGNSVPPRFMQAIAEHVYQVLLLPTRRPEVPHG